MIITHKNIVGLIHCAENSVAALYELNRKTFDLMITDCDMPGMDGICLTRHSAVIAPDMPVILMAGSISSEIPDMAKQAGAAKVLAKPFGSEELVEVIRGGGG